MVRATGGGGCGAEAGEGEGEGYGQHWILGTAPRCLIPICNSGFGCERQVACLGAGAKGREEGEGEGRWEKGKVEGEGGRGRASCGRPQCPSLLPRLLS